MNWIDIEIEVTQADKDSAAAALTMLAQAGMYIEDYSDLEQQVLEIAHIDLIEDDLLAKPRDLAIIHLYLSEEENAAQFIEKIRSALLSAEIENTISTKSLKQEDWENSWKKYYQPIEIGKRLAICPSWLEYNKDKRAVLSMDPGMAFGTGTHETTFLCLEFLENTIQGGENVLDVGCGSGILAISALLLGAKQATGIDIDAAAVKVATENAARNGVENRLNLIKGNLADSINNKFNIICANIVAAAIIELAPDIAPLLEDDGVFIASGIIAPRKNEVLPALAAAGLEIIETHEKNDWYALVCKKK